MKVTINPTNSLSGKITAPPSKAQTHRALIAGLLSNGTTTIANPLSCDDTEATAEAVSLLGAQIARKPETWRVQSTGIPQAPRNEINCGESGVTLRFMIPIVSLAGGAKLSGRRSLMQRPIEPLAKAMEKLGVKLIAEHDRLLVTGDPPIGGTVRIKGNVSSQFVSGLILAAPHMVEGLHVELTSPLESRSYVLLTIDTMKQHSIRVQANDEISLIDVPPGQRYLPADHKIPGDFSSAAYALSAAAITKSRILVRGLSRASKEPDVGLVQILSRMGAETSFQENGLLVEGGKLTGITVDLRQNPDLGPIIAVLGCYANGETKITGAERLRYKESDRLATVTSELASLGAKIAETADGLIVHGPSHLKGGTVKSHGDHRIAMALSVAALCGMSQIVIEGVECVSKSYPKFFDDLRSLGVDVIG